MYYDYCLSLSPWPQIPSKFIPVQREIRTHFSFIGTVTDRVNLLYTLYSAFPTAAVDRRFNRLVGSGSVLSTHLILSRTDQQQKQQIALHFTAPTSHPPAPSLSSSVQIIYVRIFIWTRMRRCWAVEEWNLDCLPDKWPFWEDLSRRHNTKCHSSGTLASRGPVPDAAVSCVASPPVPPRPRPERTARCCWPTVCCCTAVVAVPDLSCRRPSCWYYYYYCSAAAAEQL